MPTSLGAFTGAAILPRMPSTRALSLVFALAAALSSAYAGEVQSGPTPMAGASQEPTGSADAEKHARRTACLKDARARRLVGAQRTAFVRSCIENAVT